MFAGRSIGSAMLLLTAMAAALLSTGCEQMDMYRVKSSSTMEPPSESITARQLAQRLGMVITEQSPIAATLKGLTSTVTIYASPCGQAYVNGQPVGDGTGIVSAAGTVWVPAALETDIRQHLAYAAGHFQQPAVQQAPANNPPPVRERPRQQQQPRPRAVAQAPQAPQVAKIRGRVMIDPGHGGNDPGTKTARLFGGRHVEEKEINLAVALMVASRLQDYGLDVVMTRNDDSYVNKPKDRALAANRARADIYVSLHCDSLPIKPYENGYAIWLSPTASQQSLTLAQLIGRRMESTALDNRGTRRNTYQVLVFSSMPAVLIEMGFLSNSSDAAKLINPGTQQAVADAVAAGIYDYFAR